MDEIEEQSNGTARIGVFWSIESIEIPQCFFVYTKDLPKFWRIVNYFWRKLFNGFLFESRAEENRIGSSGILPGSMDGINLLLLKITKAERLCYHMKYKR